MITFENFYKQYGDNALLMLSWCASNICLGQNSREYPILFITGENENLREKSAIDCLSFYENSESYDLNRMILNRTGITVPKFFKYIMNINQVPVFLPEYRDNQTWNNIITSAFDRLPRTVATHKDDNSVFHYINNCYLMITGEKIPSELHDSRRCIFVNLDQHSRRYSGKFTDFPNNLADFAEIIKLNISSQEYKNLLNKAYLVSDKFKNKQIRLDQTYSHLMAGYFALTSISLIPNCLDSRFWDDNGKIFNHF
jgi:hypothetical protein